MPSLDCSKYVRIDEAVEVMEKALNAEKNARETEMSDKVIECIRSTAKNIRASRADSMSKERLGGCWP